MNHGESCIFGGVGHFELNYLDILTHNMHFFLDEKLLLVMVSCHMNGNLI